jgi:hypothetical protein
LATLNIQTWNDAISIVDDIGDLTSYEKQKAKSAILLLKDLFSQDLIDLIDEDHPIIQNLSKNLGLGLEDG